MGVTIIRSSSTTPNITNKDDARMVRYAYGGIDGYIRGYGQELSYTLTDHQFSIGSGIVVLQGWELKIGESGVSCSFANIPLSTTIYVCLELNLLSETVELKCFTYPSSTDTPDLGDDLTENPLGTARIVLYKVRKSIPTSGNLPTGANYRVTKQISAIQFSSEMVEKIRADIVSGAQIPVYAKSLISMDVVTATSVTDGLAQMSGLSFGIWAIVVTRKAGDSISKISFTMTIDGNDTLTYAAIPNNPFGTCEYNPSNKLVTYTSYGTEFKITGMEAHRISVLL